MDFLAVYSEAGMIGVVGALLVYMVYSMNKRGSAQADALQDLKTENRGQSETLENTESMLIKLIDRWNKSDERMDRKFDDLTKEINDLDNQVSEIKGVISRLNGKH
jgi:predicted RNase H-like nuclease (RuvC/YqgF family)